MLFSENFKIALRALRANKLRSVLTMLGIVVARWFIPCGISGTWEFVSFVWLAMGNCLLHAKFDFPFQIYSIFLLFLLLCSILFCVSRK